MCALTLVTHIVFTLGFAVGTMDPAPMLACNGGRFVPRGR